jgi:DNA-binding transcriptional MerR regulator
MADNISPGRPRGEQLWPPARAAVTLGVSTRALRAWDSSRKLTVQRTLGGHRRYVPDEVRALAASLTVEAVAS